MFKKEYAFGLSTGMVVKRLFETEADGVTPTAVVEASKKAPTNLKDKNAQTLSKSTPALTTGAYEADKVHK